MTVRAESYSYPQGGPTQGERLPVTPVDERPYVARVERWACDELGLPMEEHLKYLERMRARYDESRGRDMEAEHAVQRVSQAILWNIMNATTHAALAATSESRLDPKIEVGMPNPYAIPAASTEDQLRTNFGRK